MRRLHADEGVKGRDPSGGEQRTSWKKEGCLDHQPWIKVWIRAAVAQ